MTIVLALFASLFIGVSDFLGGTRQPHAQPAGNEPRAVPRRVGDARPDRDPARRERSHGPRPGPGRRQRSHDQRRLRGLLRRDRPRTDQHRRADLGGRDRAAAGDRRDRRRQHPLDARALGRPLRAAGDSARRLRDRGRRGRATTGPPLDRCSCRSSAGSASGSTSSASDTHIAARDCGRRWRPSSWGSRSSFPSPLAAARCRRSPPSRASPSRAVWRWASPTPALTTALQRGPLTVASVLGNLYPLVTIALGVSDPRRARAALACGGDRCSRSPVWR